MKVFFTCSYSGKAKYQKYYDMVLNAIKKNNVDLISTETGTYLNELTEEQKSKLKTEKKIHYLSIKRAIFEADAVIIDNSNESFRLGMEGMLTLHLKKPLLVLSVNRNMAELVQDPNLYGAKYTQYNIQWIVDDFLKKASKKLLSVRFNMFISEEHEDYLEKQSKTYEMSKSEYIRKLLEEDMK